MRWTRLSAIALLVAGAFLGTTNAECVKGWELYSGSCYKLVTTAKIWDQAKDECVKLRAALTTDLDQAEHNFLVKFMQDGKIEEAWIGAKLTKLAKVEWADGTKSNSFTKWNTAKREPNEYGGGQGCVRIDKDLWRDRRCSKSYQFICKKKAPPAKPPTMEVPVAAEINLAKGQPTWQISVGWNGASSRAVDGNKNPLYAKNSCTCTATKSKNAWWAVDMGATYGVNKVIVTNRIETSSNKAVIQKRLANYNVAVTEVSPPLSSVEDLATYRRCGQFKGTPGLTSNVECAPGTLGRYVYVYLPGTDYLNICEVEVYGTPIAELNLADSQPTSQSSTGFQGKSSRAVDGNKNPAWSGKSCTHTNKDVHPWWSVDLGQSYGILHVDVTNRVAVPERLANYQVGLSDTAPPVTSMADLKDLIACGQFKGNPPRTSKVTCGPATVGRYVYVYLPTQQYLTLCEVEVYGIPLEEVNLARGKHVWQSGTQASGPATRAVDGNKNPDYNKGKGCSCTGTILNPWWAVDLGQSFGVSRVDVMNRKNNPAYKKLADYYVVVSNIRPPISAMAELRDFRLCGQYKGIPGAGVMSTVQCQMGGVGRYVYVYLPRKDYMVLCEVEVYGLPLAEVNLARGQPTLQSGTPTQWKGVSSRAVDGDRNSAWKGSSCTLTSKVNMPWWVVDLGQTYGLNYVDVINRDDAVPERLADYTVVLTNKEPPVGDPRELKNFQLCGQYKGTPPRVSKVTCKPGVVGRYLYVYLSKTDYLTICELAAYGTLLEDVNLARAQQTWQISTAYSGKSSRAVDGNKNSQYSGHSCTHTAKKANAWWAVDLGQAYGIDSVEVINRNAVPQRLANYNVAVTNEKPPLGDISELKEFSPCGKFTGTPPRISKVSCTNVAVGRYVYIYLPGTDYLTLCEVDVSGKPVSDVNLARAQPTWQSGIAASGPSSKAVDGNMNPDYHKGKGCSCTATVNMPWWAVDLGETYGITSASVLNRQDANAYKKLADFIVVASQRQPPIQSAKELGNSRLCGQYKGIPDAAKFSTVTCRPGTVGRYVYVYIKKKDYMVLCEVEVYGRPLSEVNLALGNPASQSSTYSDGVASRAVDGNTNSNWNKKSCSCTQKNNYAWWAVDLGQTYGVETVKVTNRDDAVPERLADYTVVVSDKAPPVSSVYYLKTYRKCGQHKGTPPRTSTVTCQAGAIGRYLYIYIPRNDYLTICEVSVHGKVVSDVNLAGGRPTSQISTGYGGVSSRAVDGNVNSAWSGKSCTHTTKADKAWWSVDLGESYGLSYVKVTNRNAVPQRLANYIVAVSNVPPPADVLDLVNYRKCGQYKGNPPRFSKVKCENTTVGRYVYVYLPTSQYLTLCEVEVYGKPINEINLARGQPTWQDGIAASGPSSRAVDGNRNPDYNKGKGCSCTATANYPWWAVDLGETYGIERVDVLNRYSASASKKLANFTVLVSPVRPPIQSIRDLRKYQLCGAYDGTPEAAKFSSVSCKVGTVGRYVYVFIPRKDYMVLCEVEVRGRPLYEVNLAKGQPTAQISTGWGGVSSRAVDGNPNPDYNKKSCTCTQKQTRAWWSVDLRNIYGINWVQVINRNAVPERLSDYTVVVSNVGPPVADVSELSNYRRCGQIKGVPATKTKVTCQPGAVGRYVYIYLPKANYLTLCEVNVNGRPLSEVNFARGQPTWESSTGYGGVPSRAVDGNTNPSFSGNSCTHTLKSASPWWAVDLGESYGVTWVRVINRVAVPERLANYNVIASYEKPPVLSIKDMETYRTCGSFKGTPPRVSKVTCRDGAVGRYVYIYLPGSNYLTLCEVEVHGLPLVEVNLARAQPTWQSGIGASGDSKRAVDGNRNPNYHAGKGCSCTATVSNPWWAVDLGETYGITKVDVLNRYDANAAKKLANYVVLVSQTRPPVRAITDLRQYHLCGKYDGTPEAAKFSSVVCKAGSVGRYVYIYLPKKDYLVLCEVEVSGRPVGSVNLAKGQKTWQSSTGWGGVSTRAVDGNKNPDYNAKSCTCTQKDKNAWWAVDLGMTYGVEYVKVTNRNAVADRLAGYTVVVSNVVPPVASVLDLEGFRKCGGVKGTPATESKVQCLPGAVGRYLYIYLPKSQYLTLCEVRVYGTPLNRVNLARSQPTWEIQTAYGGVPSRAVDGNRNSAWSGKSCTHTTKSLNAWWAVDLGICYGIKSVQVTNRNAVPERLSNYIVAVTNEEPPVAAVSELSDYEKCGQFKGKPPRQSKVSCGPGVVGRYVYVYLPISNYLTLCEVEVSGMPVSDVNLARARPAYQIDVTHNGLPARAVDGNKNPKWAGNSCSHTSNIMEPWWAVDLQRSYGIDKVVVTNRVESNLESRLSDYVVAVSNRAPQNLMDITKLRKCGQFKGVPPESSSVQCIEGIVGRYVYVYLARKGILTLCEVEVFGTPVEEVNLARGQNTWQSSSGWGGVSTRAVDGNKNPDYNKKSCTCTQKNNHSWWAVDLHEYYGIKWVEVTNRNAVPDRLKDYIVAVTNRPPPVKDVKDLDTYPRCGQYKGVPPTTTKIRCQSGAVGRYVYVYLPGSNYLTLCEVEVNGIPMPDVNLAEGRPTKQINTGFGGLSSRAVDGNPNSAWSGRSCTHTNKANKAWWSVDLGQSYGLTWVAVTNRNAVPERLANYIVAATMKAPPVASVNDLDTYSRCGQFKGTPPTNSKLTCQPGAIGQYVYVYLPSSNYLTLCEVEVHGEVFTTVNLARGKPASQSSTRAAGGAASRAVDGNSNSDFGGNSCSHTNNEDYPWWSVDMGQRYKVLSVEVKNRNVLGERLANYVVALTDTKPTKLTASNVGSLKQCGAYKGTPPIVSRVQCKAGAVGRHAVIYLPKKGILTLCEVSIFGSFADDSSNAGEEPVPVTEKPETGPVDDGIKPAPTTKQPEVDDVTMAPTTPPQPESDGITPARTTTAPAAATIPPVDKSPAVEPTTLVMVATEDLDDNEIVVTTPKLTLPPGEDDGVDAKVTEIILTDPITQAPAKTTPPMTPIPAPKTTLPAEIPEDTVPVTTPQPEDDGVPDVKVTTVQPAEDGVKEVTETEAEATAGLISKADQETIISIHNDFRSNANPTASKMAKIVWNNDLARLAQDFVNNCQFYYQDPYTMKRALGYGMELGQNVGAGYHGSTSWRTVINYWNSEQSKLSLLTTQAWASRNYRQLLQGRATHVGCGYKYCPQLAATVGYTDLYVCDYAYGLGYEASKYYEQGESCSGCAGKCNGKLCDCAPNPPMCRNAGVIDLKTCTCTCATGWSGRECETAAQ